MNKNKKSSEIKINREISGKYLFLLLIRVFFPFLTIGSGFRDLPPAKHAFIAEFVKTGGTIKSRVSGDSFLSIDMKVGPATIMTQQGEFSH